MTFSGPLWISDYRGSATDKKQPIAGAPHACLIFAWPLLLAEFFRPATDDRQTRKENRTAACERRQRACVLGQTPYRSKKGWNANCATARPVTAGNRLHAHVPDRAGGPLPAMAIAPPRLTAS
jgi:hypothetical protein